MDLKDSLADFFIDYKLPLRNCHFWFSYHKKLCQDKTDFVSHYDIVLPNICQMPPYLCKNLKLIAIPERTSFMDRKA